MASSDPPKVKLLCSFGGKILPRPNDGVLRYAGGHTRIVSLRRSSTLSDLLSKISQISNGPISAVKYQLPDEDLDALISISSQEDLDNMMEEFDRISDLSPDGSARMRIFLFSPSDLAAADSSADHIVDTGQTYIDAVNGVGVGLKRKNSLVSAASSNEGTSPSLLSPTAHDASSRLGFFSDETLVSGRVEQQQVQFLNPSVNVVSISPGQAYIHPIYVNAAPMVSVGGNLKPTQGNAEHSAASGDQMLTVGGNLKPNQGKMEVFPDDNSSQADQNSNKGFYRQPLSQLPPLHPSLVQNNAYVPPLRPIAQQGPRFADCQMCQRLLPHAHSDTLINEYPNASGNGNGSESSVLESRPVLQSYYSEDLMRLQALRVESSVDSKDETTDVASVHYSRQLENERVANPNAEALDHSKVLHPPVVSGVVADPARLQAPLRVVAGAMDAVAEPKAEISPTGGQLGVYGFTEEVTRPLEKERPVHANVEALDPAKVLHPQRAGPGALTESTIEVKVDNKAPSAQYGAYGFPQSHYLPQPYDNGRMLVPPNMQTFIQVPVDTHTSYGVFAHPSQVRFTDPFQQFSQTMVHPSYQVKQDVTSVKNGNLHIGEPPSRVSVRPIDTMEGHDINTLERSGNSEHLRPTPAVNLSAPMLKPENTTLAVENNHQIKQQFGGNAVFPGNGFINSGIIPDGNSARPMNQLPPPSADLKPENPSLPADNSQAFRSQIGSNPVYLGNAFIASGNFLEGNSVRPVNQMPPPSLEYTHFQTMQLAEMGKPSVIANHGTVFANHGTHFPNERLYVMPSYSYGINPPHNNNAINLVPVGERKDEASRLHSKDLMLNDISGTPSVTAPIQYANSSASNGHVEQFQGSVPSDSLLSNPDPRNILGNAQIVPPMPNKVPSKEFLVPKDLLAENLVVKNKVSDAAMQLEDGALHHLQNPANKELCTEPVRFLQGEEQNKQEVHALAEQLVASGLQPSVPIVPVSFPHEIKEADLPSNRESVLSEANVLVQAIAPVADQKTEGITNKLADKTNFGFPVMDDNCRLQIIKNSDLEELRELGSGTFGTVYHGKWRGSDVAIKRINDRCFAAKPSEEERMRADFWNEASMLADLHHPNVVAFYGVVLDGPGGTFATVTEFMVNGSLRRALRKNDKTLDKRKRLLIAMDVAFGMEYLHGKNLIHFDLKSDNLLVNLRDPQRPICKVADLGLSKVKCQTLISGGVRGTLPWMAPELLNGGSNRVSEKVDVFSFGIVMWELLTGEEPYADLHYGAIIGGIVSNTLRPPVPESCDPEWRSLMEQCWSAEPSERPNFTEIANRLRSMAASRPQKV